MRRNRDDRDPIRRRKTGFSDAVVFIAFIALGLLIAAKLEQGEELVRTAPFEIIDGDTLASGDEKMRLAGIDAPELDQTCSLRELPWACGKRARDELGALVSGLSLTECRGRTKDRYGRTLVRCRSGQTNINARMVLAGMAVDYGGDYSLEEIRARQARRGMWAGEFDVPENWRRQKHMDQRESYTGAVLSFLSGLIGWK